MKSVKILFPIVVFFRYTNKTPAFGDLLQHMIVGHLYFPLVSWVAALFTRDAYCIARPCYGFLSVRQSVSRKVCPRRRAVSLRQLSFLYSSRAIQRRGTLHTEPFFSVAAT